MADKMDVIDVAAYAAKGIEIPVGKNYLVTINGDPYIFNEKIITRNQVLKAVGLKGENVLVYQIINDSDIEVLTSKETIDLGEPGFEKFVVKESFVFNYLVDNDPETSDKQNLTANQILKKAAYKSSEYYLVEILPDGTQKSYKDSPEEEIKLTHSPEKKFISIYRGDMPVS